jgi:hypothetical protein
VRRAVLLLAVLTAMWLAGRGVSAQEAGCAPVEVGEDTGIFFLALGGSCTFESAEGLEVIAHLARDDNGSELLVLADPPRLDAETAEAAQMLVSAVIDGGVDGQTWHFVDEP